MKNNLFNKKFWIPHPLSRVLKAAGMAIFVSLLFVAQAKADEQVIIRLQIKTSGASLYDQEIAVSECADSSTASTTSVNARCAVEQSGLISDWSWWGEDAFLNSVGDYANDYENGIYWAWFSDLEYGQVALNSHVLTEGEKLLLVYGVNPLRISVNDDSPFVSATSTITVEQFGLDESWNPVWMPAASSSLIIAGQQIENDSGVYEYAPLSAGEKNIYAKKDGYVDSEMIIISAREMATSTIKLQIETSDGSLYDQELAVSECADSSTASTTSVNARCAVEQSGLISDWSWWGEDAFLNSVGDYANDYENGIYWAWFSDLEYGQVALNSHVLTEGEKLLLVYGVNPLRISVNDDSPFVSATSTITVEQFGLDESWNPVWMPAASSTLIIGGEEHENDTGIYFFTASSTGQVAVYGKKDDYVNSDQIILTVQAPEAPAEDSAPANNNQSGGSVIIPSSGGGSPTPALPAAKVNLNKAIDFLISKQSAEGSFGSVLITDWAAIALASANPNGASAQKIKSYLLTDPDSAAGLNPVSDYARRAIALMALNISPYDGAKTDYVKKITELFDGQQFGDASLYNDDIFALLALNKSGYGAEDEMIRKTVDFIIAKQRADGSWIGSDLTAAAVQALAPVSALNGVSAALQKARNFLAYAQGADGGYGNTYTTSWVMQAIAVLGEDAGSWQKNNKTPESYLAASQAEDGGLEKGNEYMDNRLWATAYAIPAAQGKGWLNIMNNFSRPNQAEITPDNSAASGHLTATSTLELHQTASSTADVLGIASSSSENLITATGTPAELMEKNVKTETENMVEKKAEPAKAAAAWKKAEEPKVLAVKIARPEPVSFIKKQEPEKADQATTRTQTAPAEDVKSAANLTAADAGQPAAEANIFVLTGRLIYRGFRYVLNLLGF